MVTKKKAATSTERARDLRKRREAEGLTEVRGIWAKPGDAHRQIKAYARGVGQMKGSKRELRLQKSIDELLQ